jgi:hypothetical protein
MIVTFHIFMTIVSLFFAGYMSMHPVKTKLRITYIAILCTVLSGIFLVMQTPEAMIHTITSGILYLATISICMATARHKLAQTTSA